MENSELGIIVEVQVRLVISTIYQFKLTTSLAGRTFGPRRSEDNWPTGW